jgi:PST family polysaccharide transporter
VTLRSREARAEAAALLKLGFAFMASGFLMMAAGYAVRTLVLRKAGLDAAGLYQSAWSIGGVDVAFVLQAMGADFYPRLVGAHADPVRANRLVNEQTRVSLLIAAPGVLLTITLAPLVLVVLYSQRFAGAAEVLRWICCGMALRVVTWPMGYIVVAQARQLIYLATEVAWTLVNVGLAWLCIDAFGTVGAGIAFAGSYVFHALMIYPVVHRLTGFSWSAANVRGTAAFVLSMSLVLAGFYLLPPVHALLLGLAVAAASTLHSIRALSRLGMHAGVPPRIRRAVAWLSRAPAHS